MKRNLCLWMIVSCVLLLGGEAQADEVELSVKPVLCITDNRNPSCDMSFLVVWQSEAAGYYCLFNDFAAEPLRCWSEDNSGQINDQRVVQRRFSYWMTDSESESRLAQVDVEVLRTGSDDRRRNRRTRHVWDIN